MFNCEFDGCVAQIKVYNLFDNYTIIHSLFGHEYQKNGEKQNGQEESYN